MEVAHSVAAIAGDTEVSIVKFSQGKERLHMFNVSAKCQFCNGCWGNLSRLIGGK